jgi:hypothetical protein
MSKHVTKFNTLLEMFLSDLSATVPHVQSLSSARDWITSLLEVDPGNDRVVSMFMQALQGAQEFLVNRDVSFFKNFKGLPSIISADELFSIFMSLGEDDKSICWRYLQKLAKVGMQAMKESGLDIDPALMNQKAIELLLKQTPSDMTSLSTMDVPSGPIVENAFKALQDQYTEAISHTGLLPPAELEALQQYTFEQFTDRLKTQYPEEATQRFLTDTLGLVTDYGLPCVRPDQMAKFDTCESKDQLVEIVMQLGTVHVTLNSVDAGTITAVENVARDFLQLVQNGDIDLGDISDPFQLLNSLAASGVADSLMASLGAQ